MPSLGYKLRRYRIHLAVLTFFLLVMFHYSSESNPNSKHVGDAGSADLINSRRTDFHEKQDQKHLPPLGRTDSTESGNKLLEEFNKLPLQQSIGLSGENSLDTVVEKEDRTDSSRNKIPNLRANNGNNQHEFNLENYEILSEGMGAARMDRNKAGNKPLPPVKVPRVEKFPPKSKIYLPQKQQAISDTLGKVQDPNTEVETDQQKTLRLERRSEVQKVLKTSWDLYKKYAWGTDEVKPISRTGASPFLGWAATMVDSMDTLYIAGLENDFNEAVDYVSNIDFTTSWRDDIPLFETVIRYLGGLLSAYDVSHAKHKILLTKAIELADNLIGAFDTPNRMPMTFFKWTDKDTKLKYRAAQDAVTSEVTSMTVEFTRLAQLTGNQTYYDAVARITDALYEWAPESAVPWMFPTLTDVSGCKVSLEESLSSESYSSEGNGRSDSSSSSPPSELLIPTAQGSFRKGICYPKGMTEGAHAFPQMFTFGGLVDSTYEYFMKEYQLLQAGEPKYKKLYEKMTEAALSSVIYRPKVPTDDELLFIGQRVVKSDGSSVDNYEMQHLTCFAGGMFALGGKLLNRPEDVKLGARLTQGCVWAYNATESGVMPESFTVENCPGGTNFNLPCEWQKKSTPKVRIKEPGEIEQVGERLNHNGVLKKRESSQQASASATIDISTFTFRERFPEYFVRMDSKYQLRPEAVESVFYMYRITGDRKWQEDGWRMFQSIVNLTQIKENGKVIGYTGVSDVNVVNDSSKQYLDVSESFWMGETLKYLYLLFDEPKKISLDDYVFNTEAHPFKVPR